MTTLAEPHAPPDRPRRAPDRDAVSDLSDQGTLSFHANGGPVLAVCGTCGGAGASSLAYLIALAAARSSEGHVLVCDTGGPTAGLASYAGVESRHSLAEAAQILARGEQLAGPLYASAGAGVRIIASSPGFLTEGDPEAVDFVFEQARAAHALTVVDCGTLSRAIEQQALGLATHIAWLLPATISGLRRAERVLDVVDGLDATEILIARHDHAGRRPPLAELSALADRRGAPLVLMPHIADLGEEDAADALDAAQVTLEAIGTVIRR